MHDTVDPGLEDYRTLLDVAKAIASHRNLSELFQDLTARLHRVLDYHYLSVVLYDAAQHVMRLHNLEASKRSTLQPGAAFAVEDTLGLGLAASAVAGRPRSRAGKPLSPGHATAA